MGTRPQADDVRRGATRCVRHRTGGVCGQLISRGASVGAHGYLYGQSIRSARANTSPPLPRTNDPAPPPMGTRAASGCAPHPPAGCPARGPCRLRPRRPGHRHTRGRTAPRGGKLVLKARDVEAVLQRFADDTLGGTSRPHRPPRSPAREMAAICRWSG
jgi:hypothetical protein